MVIDSRSGFRLVGGSMDVDIIFVGNADGFFMYEELCRWLYMYQVWSPG